MSNALSDDRQLTRSWIIYGATAGIVAGLAYTTASVEVPFLGAVNVYLGMAFGPLLAVAYGGMYHFFWLHRNTVALQAATLYGIIAGTLVNLMVVVQSAIHLTIPAGAREGLGLAYAGVNMVQLGMDVSWDIYLSVATVLLGLVMAGHPRFGRIWAAAALLLGGGLLVLNLASFPVPPASAGSIDLGLACGMLFLAVAIRILASLKWVDSALSG
ncbi:MAG TPA: hypothetical protein VFX49_08320 [Chloroflexota bacterium]|nr:hypothetical protein [Chloroflexota bacterium]